MLYAINYFFEEPEMGSPPKFSEIYALIKRIQLPFAKQSVKILKLKELQEALLIFLGVKCRKVCSTNKEIIKVSYSKLKIIKAYVSLRAKRNKLK